MKVDVKREEQSLVLDLPEGLLDVYLSNDGDQEDEEDDGFKWTGED